MQISVYHSLVTGQLADTPTLGLPTRGLDNLRTGQLAACPVRELSSPRVVQSASWQSTSCRIRELSSNPFINGKKCTKFSLSSTDVL